MPDVSKVILDTDINTDCGDAGALALLHVYLKKCLPDEHYAATFDVLQIKLPGAMV